MASNDARYRRHLAQASQRGHDRPEVVALVGAGEPKHDAQPYGGLRYFDEKAGQRVRESPIRKPYLPGYGNSCFACPGNVRVAGALFLISLTVKAPSAIRIERPARHGRMKSPTTGRPAEPLLTASSFPSPKRPLAESAGRRSAHRGLGERASISAMHAWTDWTDVALSGVPRALARART
jgi:hypothetical protein